MTFEPPFWSPAQLDKGQFSFHVDGPACVGPAGFEFFMGGVAMACAIDAAERTTGKPLLWATMQFLAPGAKGDDVAIEVEQLGGGRATSQITARLKAGDRFVNRMAAALGGKDNYPTRQFVQMPDVPVPLECPTHEDTINPPGSLMSVVERREAAHDSEYGTHCAWMRPLFGMKMSASWLAIISDFFLGVHELSRPGTSLDNTIRIHRLVESEWVLVATKLSGMANGVASGNCYLFAQDGTLLAQGGQTGLLPRESAGIK